VHWVICRTGRVAVRWILAITAVAGVLFGGVQLEAQSVSAPALTAAFLFNFVRFTTWPADVLANGTAIVVCVSGDDRVAESLVQLTRDKKVEGHALSVRRTDLRRPLTGCHLVYAAALDWASTQELVRAASGRPILTVSDASDFARRGGVANFFLIEGQMRFAVNPAAADRARLRISSRLLTLGSVVGDDITP
jgi:hypothetical protein